MKSDQESGHYEVTPARMAFRGLPIPELNRPAATGGRDSWSVNPVDARGIRTRSDSVGAAQKRASARIRDALKRVGHGDVTGILDLLHEHPEYIGDPQFRKTYFQLLMKGRLRRAIGRPAEKYTVHPLVIAGLVDECVLQGLKKNKEKAFELVSERIGYMSYFQVKSLYYKAYREERFRAVLIQKSDLVRHATPEDLEALLSAEALQPGGSIRRTAHDPELGQVDIQFDAI